jgi:SAM-dependent methyltransferase
MNEIEIVNKTARATGAVGAKAITPKYVAETSHLTDKILDYGAGRNPIHTKSLIDKGFMNVAAYDVGANNVPGVHDSGAIQRKFDTVFASNVLNVAPSESFLRKTLAEISSTVGSGGRAVFNYPSDPRKLGWTVSRMEAVIKEYFPVLLRVGGTASAPLWEAWKTPRVKEGQPPRLTWMVTAKKRSGMSAANTKLLLGQSRK